MKFLILNTDYPEFLRWLYTQQAGLGKQPYEEQMRLRMKSLFGVADFLSVALNKLGHQGWDIYFNNELMQKAWGREHGFKIGSDDKWRFRLWRGVLPWLSRIPDQKWFYNVLAAQIKDYQPDVLFNWAMDSICPSFLKEVKKDSRLLIGLGEPPVLLNKQDLRVYDLVLASSEGMVDYFRKQGIKAELLRFGFGSQVLSLLNQPFKKTIPVSFIGSLGRLHLRRRQLLEKISATMADSVLIWAPAIDDLPPNSPVHERYQGPAWGRDLYRILLSSKITLNCHLDIAGEFADNMRLFEATGIGTLLITDWKKNLNEMFKLGKEVIAYRTPKECAEKIRYYLTQDKEREKIAKAGQKRTLREHTYYQRMEKLLEIIKKYL